MTFSFSDSFSDSFKNLREIGFPEVPSDAHLLPPVPIVIVIVIAIAIAIVIAIVIVIAFLPINLIIV